MQGETSESPNFNAVTAGQGSTHLLQYGLDTKLHIQVCKVPLNFSQLVYQFRFSHWTLAISLIVIVILICASGAETSPFGC
jgi:hypothetical protein